jgi:hypothetical protein
MKRYIPEDRLLHNHHCENLNSYRLLAVADELKVLLEMWRVVANLPIGL